MATAQQSSIHTVLQELKNLIPDEAFRDALANNGPLYQYLHILKDLRDNPDRNKTQEFFDAQIVLLETKLDEKPSEVPAPPLENDTAASSVAGFSIKTIPEFFFQFLPQSLRESATPSYSGQATNNYTKQVTENISSNICPTQPHTEVTVTYKCIVGGNTLEKHLDLLKKLNGHIPGPDPVFLRLQEAQHDEESQVVILFCPVVSRVGTDAEAALHGVSSDKPVILVMMHHMHTARSLPAPGPYPGVKLGVSVFFHETVSGLLECKENDEAISAIQRKLLEYSTKNKSN